MEGPKRPMRPNCYSGGNQDTAIFADHMRSGPMELLPYETTFGPTFENSILGLAYQSSKTLDDARGISGYPDYQYTFPNTVPGRDTGDSGEKYHHWGPTFREGVDLPYILDRTAPLLVEPSRRAHPVAKSPYTETGGPSSINVPFNPYHGSNPSSNIDLLGQGELASMANGRIGETAKSNDQDWASQQFRSRRALING